MKKRFSTTPAGSEITPTLKGFTLLELLISIAIIAALAALLFPAMQSARNSSKNAVCVANLRNLGIAFASFNADHNGLFPDMRTGTSSTFWMDDLLKYTSRKSFICPATKNTDSVNTAIQNGKLFSDATTWDGLKFFTSYGYNFRYLSPTFSRGTGANPIPWTSITRTTVKRPSEMILLTDAGRINSAGQPSYGYYLVEFPSLQDSMPAPWHREQANVLWVDGHVSPSLCALTKADSFKYLTMKNWDAISQ